MKQVLFGKTGIKVPAVVVGCMRIGNMDQQELGKFVHGAMDLGANFFDHADIYDGGRCEEHFGQILASDKSLHREDMFIQSKCGIVRGMGKAVLPMIVALTGSCLLTTYAEWVSIEILYVFFNW